MHYATKKMKMKKLLGITIISLLLSFQIIAQVNIKFLSNNQEMILSAIDSTLVIYKQEYVLQSVNDSSLRFGSNGNSYFGKSYTLGVVADNKIWFNKTVLSPWINDSNFTKYQKSDTLKPVLSKSYIRFVYQTEYTEIPFDSSLFVETNDSLNKENLYATFEFKNILSGLKTDSLISEEGWLVVAYSANNIEENDTCDINWLIYKQKPDFQPKNKTGKVKTPDPNGKIIGGAFIKPKFQAGCIEFYLGGILHKGLLNWVVAATTVKLTSKNTIIKDSKTITPIPNPQNKSNKKQKNSK